MYEKRGESDNRRDLTSQFNILVAGWPDTISKIEEILHGQPYSIDTADSIEKGKEKLSANSYDAVITDEPAIAFRAGEKTIRISSNPEPSDVLSALEDRVNSYKLLKQTLKNKKIVVVDDEQNYLMLCKQQLEDKGYEVITVDNYEDAIYAVIELKAEMLITDYAFDKTSSTDGLKLAKDIKFLKPEIPIILQTEKKKQEFENIKIRARQKEYGIHVVIQKLSDNPNLLVETVNETMQKYYGKIKVDTQGVLADLKAARRKSEKSIK